MSTLQIAHRTVHAYTQLAAKRPLTEFEQRVLDGSQSTLTRYKGALAKLAEYTELVKTRPLTAAERSKMTNAKATIRRLTGNHSAV